MNNIKICIVTTISKTMDWFIIDYARELAKNNYDVTLISNMDESFISRNQDFAQCISIPMKRGIKSGGIFKNIVQLLRIFKDHKYDIVQYATPNAALYASIASKIAGVKIRIYSQWGIRYVGFKGIKRLLFKKIEKFTCRLSTHVKGVSYLNRKFAISEKLCKEEKISVIGKGGTIGVDLTLCDLDTKPLICSDMRKKYNIPIDAFVYGYVGRINADKGINELITAYRQINIDCSNVYLILVGMMDDVNPITDYNLEWIINCNRVVMTGNVSSIEVYSYIASFDILVHPTYREGFGKVLQEAMAMAVPIITTNIPGASEVIENGISGVLVEARNANELYEKMNYLKDDMNLRNIYGLNGRIRVEKYFNRPIMLKNILEDFNQIFVSN
ncbi:MAG: glycosyltransferase family 4 protein [Bacillota bacterium]